MDISLLSKLRKRASRKYYVKEYPYTNTPYVIITRWSLAVQPFRTSYCADAVCEELRKSYIKRKIQHYRLWYSLLDIYIKSFQQYPGIEQIYSRPC